MDLKLNYQSLFIKFKIDKITINYYFILEK